MIKETVIPLPPITEQRRIVIAIEAAFEQLDNITAILA
jgi:restriction endonuclease S subunit